MKVPLNWLKKHIEVPSKLDVLTHELTMAGHMLDGKEMYRKDIVIDLELRGNRADCYSIRGIAREISALFSKQLKEMPLYTKRKSGSKSKDFSLTVASPLVKRVMMITIKNVVLTSSPAWLKDALKQYGLESVNNIVDLTNYVAIETGQPMHAFDLSKIDPMSLSIRDAKPGESIMTFLGNKLVLTKDDLVWADKNATLSLAGAMGDKIHSMSADTKDILLEAASYDRASIRRSIHRYSLFTEAGIRHEKELDPELVDVGIRRFLHFIEENKWGTIGNELYEYYPQKVKPQKIKLTYEHLKTIAGFEIDEKNVKDILKRLNFEILNSTTESLEVKIPTYRTDVELEEDVIEEILRINGYENVPITTLSLEIPKLITPPFINQEISFKNHLTALGFNETIGLPFVLEKYLKYNQSVSGIGEKIKISNRPSPDLEELRQTLFATLVESGDKVKNERGTRVAFFEIGKIYIKTSKNYDEKRTLGIVYWSKDENDYYTFKGYLDALFAKIGLENATFELDKNKIGMIHTYKIISNTEVIGYGGLIDGYHYVEIDLEMILGKTTTAQVSLWPKYPPQIEDVTFETTEKTKIGHIVNEILKTDFVKRCELVDIFKNAYTFRIWYQSDKKTLTNDEVAKVHKSIVEKVEKRHFAKEK